MTLAEYVTSWAAELGRWIEDDDVAVIDVAAPSENLDMVGRIITGWAQKDAPDALFVSGDTRSEAEFARTVVADARETASQLRRVALADGIELGEPGLGDACDAADALAVAARLARWAQPLARCVVIGSRLAPEGAPRWLDAAIAHCTRATKIVLLREERTAGPAVPAHWLRAERALSASLENARRDLAALIRGHGSRALVMNAPADAGLAFVEREVQSRAAARSLRVRTTCVSAREAAFRSLELLGNEPSGDPFRDLALAIEARGGDRAIVLGVAIENDPRAPRNEAWTFAREVGRYLIDGSGGVVVVEVGPRSVPRADHRIVHHPFRVDADRIEQGLRDALSSAPSIGERVHLESGLATFASGRGQSAEAVEHVERALRAALDTRRPELLMSALYVAGSVLSRAARVDESVCAYARCGEIALEISMPAMAGRALSAIGHVYLVNALADHAVRFYEAAVVLGDRAGDTAGALHASTWLGQARAQAGDLGAAAGALDAAARTRAALPAIDDLLGPSRGEAMARLAAIMREAGLAQRADDLARRAAECGFAGPASQRPCG